MFGLWWFRWSWLSKYGSTIHHGQPNHLSVKLSILLTSSLKEEKKHPYPVLLLLLWHIILSFWYVRKIRLLTYQLTDGWTYKCSYTDGGRIIAPRGFLFHVLSFFLSFITGFHKIYNNNLPRKNASFFMNLIRIRKLSGRHGRQTDRQTDSQTN